MQRLPCHYTNLGTPLKFNHYGMLKTDTDVHLPQLDVQVASFGLGITTGPMYPTRITLQSIAYKG